MIDIVKSREVFKKYLDRFDNKNDQSFVFKVTHTYSYKITSFRRGYFIGRIDRFVT